MLPLTTRASARQPQLLDPLRSTPQALPGLDGRRISRPEACALLDCQRVEVVPVTEELVFVLDQERKLRQPCLENLVATSLWYQHRPAARGFHCICGRAILCHVSQFS